MNLITCETKVFGDVICEYLEESQERTLRKQNELNYEVLLGGQRAQLSKGSALMFYPEMWCSPCRPQPWEREGGLGPGNAIRLV